MNTNITNEEFHEAYSSLPKHNAPPGYWDKIHEERRKHPFVGRKTVHKIEGTPRKVIIECVEAEDDLVIFKFPDSTSQLIVTGDDVANIRWMKM